ncbi:MAG: Gfo/Idh/MocA family oxidoreductase [Thermoguttaceae bacterium]|nr:Gfo/Idh/MocA family oxidoreductase [Thermoguttaceae bacterium]
MESRRHFLRTSGTLAGLTMAGGLFTSAPAVHAGENNTIKIAIIGCGGRGRGAMVQALTADKQAKLWAVADAFADKATDAIRVATEAAEDQVDVSPDRIFIGLDAYKKAIDTLGPGDVVILTTPPAFRPLHFAYAVERGVNIFAEKPLAVDIPGLKQLRETNKIAKEKGLHVAVGLNNRHYFRTEETVKAIQDGKIGEITSMWVNRMHSTHRPSAIGDYTLLQHQLRNIFIFNWTTGGFIVDALIHNIDICCWAKGELPVRTQGMGGRIHRTYADQMIDIGAIEYEFADGHKLMVQAKTMDNIWNSFFGVVHGTKGSAILGEGVGTPRLYEGFRAAANEGKIIWESTAKENNSYQTEHDLFFKAIRENQPWNEMDRGIDTTFTAIFGRMGMETGQLITSDEAWNSTFAYVPNIAEMTIDSDAPVKPDANGDYPQPIPGITQY